MTRFEQEISGALGAWWKEHAEQEVRDAVRDAENNAEVDEFGAIRWKSNKRYLMDDFCEKLEYACYPFSRRATAEARREADKKFFAEYRKNPPKMTPEMYAEMRAAFGDGAVVVDVITGRKIKL